MHAPATLSYGAVLRCRCAARTCSAKYVLIALKRNPYFDAISSMSAGRAMPLSLDSCSTFGYHEHRVCHSRSSSVNCWH